MAGDSLVFHFSGHGSQIRDLDGDEVKDHMDEVICPHDMNWDKEGTGENDGFITDDELDTRFRELPRGVNLEVLLDSCHSGTGTREMAALAQLPCEHYLRPRFLALPVDIASRQDDDLAVTHLLCAALCFRQACLSPLDRRWYSPAGRVCRELNSNSG